MWTIRIKEHFDAAHRLPNYKGLCANLHGHTWLVEIFFAFKELQPDDMAKDFKLLKENIKKVIDIFDHQSLNDFFENPTAENIAKELFRLIKTDEPEVFKVVVWESPNAGVEYSEA